MGSPADFTVVAVGSAMFTRKLRSERPQGFHDLLTVVREADAAFLNLEAPIREPSSYPVKQYLYTSYVTSEPWVAEELDWAGFNLVSLANNHMSDWSPASVSTNARLLTGAGIVSSGAGPTLSDARAPGYFDTARGRVGLVSVDSSYEYGQFFQVQMASDPHGGVPGRPGTNGLRWETEYELDPESYAHFWQIHRALGLHREGIETSHRPPSPTENLFRFGGVTVCRADAARKRTACRASDLYEILRWIRNARAQVDYLLVSHHQHAANGEDWELPADFAVEFAHAAVDSGADAYIGHGYTSRGVEIYNGRPIFYDLGDWATQDASARRHPADAYEHWGLEPKATPGEFADARELARNNAQNSTENPEFRVTVNAYTQATSQAALVRFSFRGRELSDVTLYPTVPTDGPRHRRGTPILVTGAQADHVLGRFARASELFGTKLEIRDGLGEVVLT